MYHQLATHPNVVKSLWRGWMVFGLMAAIFGFGAIVAGVGLIAVLGPVAILVTFVLLIGALGFAALLGWSAQRAGWFGVFGDSNGAWKVRGTGSPISLSWYRLWNTPPGWDHWIYSQLLAGNLTAVGQLGAPTGINIGELYVAVYAAPADRVAFVCVSSQSAKRAGVDTGWRPIELRGEWYDYARTVFPGF